MIAQCTHVHDKALEKRYAPCLFFKDLSFTYVCIIMPSWDSTCAMCKTRRWRKDMGVVCIMGGVCIMAPNLTSSGPPPPWLIIMPMTSPFSYIYMCWTIDNAEVAFLSILIIWLSDYCICDPRYILCDVAFCTFQRNNIFDRLDFCELRHLTRQRGGVMQSSKSCLEIS